MLKSACRKLFNFYLHAKNQLYLYLLFWDILKTLKTCYFGNFGNAHPHQNHSTDLLQTSMLIRMQKMNFITYFKEILQRNNKLFLGNLRMPGHIHLKWWYQLEETIEVYLQAKNQLHPSCFPIDLAKILKSCCFE